MPPHQNKHATPPPQPVCLSAWLSIPLSPQSGCQGQAILDAPTLQSCSPASFAFSPHLMTLRWLLYIRVPHMPARRREKKAKGTFHLSKQFHPVTSAYIFTRTSLLATREYGEFYLGMLLPEMKCLSRKGKGWVCSGQLAYLPQISCSLNSNHLWCSYLIVTMLLWCSLPPCR